MIFNEDKLQEEIIKTWGEFGVHNEVFKAMKRQISDLKQLTLTDVSNCPFEAYAVFCIECDRQGLKPIKYKDYLNLG